MATITYEEIHTDNLITLTMAPLVQNFQTIDSFIKNFTTFQRKFNQMQKLQKASAQDLSNFKMSTLNSFSTLNQMMDSRNSVGQGSSQATLEEIAELKKNLKQLKSFVTESTREVNQGLEIKEKETLEAYKKYDEKIGQLKESIDSNKWKIGAIQTEITQMNKKFASKSDFQTLRIDVKSMEISLQQAHSGINQIDQLLKKLNVEEFKNTLDKMAENLNNDMAEMKVKLKLKTDISDTLKLQDMLLNLINFTYQNVAKKYSTKNETKKALIFLEKRLNNLTQAIFNEEEGDKQAMLATKGWKCISCSKDLGQLQGKLDKYKAWSVFPAKQTQTKDKYSGFGSGFQSIIETAVTKKGGEVSYDELGRMTSPYNLTREVQGSLLKPSHSQSKFNNVNSKAAIMKQVQSQTNYMNLFGRNNETDIDLRGQYMQKQRGLMSRLKHLIEQSSLRSQK